MDDPEQHNGGYHFKDDQPQRRGLQFDWTISIGQIGTMAMIIISFVVAYTRLEGRTTNNETQTAQVKEGMQELKDNVRALNSTLVDTNLAVRELRTTVILDGRKTRENQDH